MIKWIQTILFVLICVFAGAQNSTIQELIKSLDAKTPKSKINTMYEIGDQFSATDTDEALKWFKKGIDFSWGLNADDLAVNGLLRKSHLELSLKEYVQALNTCLRVLNYDVKLDRKTKRKLYTDLGDALEGLHAFDLSLKYRNRILMEFSENMSSSELYYLTENIGYQYSRFGNIDSANYYYKTSIAIAESTLDTNLILHCYNNIGYHFSGNNLVEKSVVYYDKGISLFELYAKKESKDSILYAMILANRSDYLIKNGEFTAAKSEIYKSNNFLAGSDSSYYAGNILRLVALYVKESKIDSVQKYIGLSNMFCDDISYYEKHLENLINYYRLINDKEGEIDAVSKLLNLIKKRKNNATNAMFVELIEIQYQQVRKNLVRESELLKNEAALDKTRMKLIISFLGLLLVISVTLFFIWRKKRKQIDLQKLLLKEKEIALGNKKTQKLSQQLNNRNQDLTEFGIEISLKNDLMNNVLAMLKLPEDSPEKTAEIIKMIERHRKVDESLTIFHQNVEKVNFEFMNKLALNYPNLTANDHQICAMLKLQFSSKEIATLKNISTDSVKKIRYRLRKKMNLAPKEDLSKFFRDY